MSDALLDALPRRAHLAEPEEHVAERVMRLHEERGLAGPPGQAKEMLGHRARRGQLAAHRVEPAEPDEDGEELRGVPELLAQRAGAAVALLHLARGLALHGDERGAELAAQAELPARPRVAGGQAREHVERAREVADDLAVRRAPGRARARASPVQDGGLGQPRLRVVVRDQLRLLLRGLREALDEHARDALVVLLARAPEQRLVRGVLDQGVLEHVARAGAGAALVQHLGGHEPAQGGLEHVVVQVRHGADQLERERPADARGELGDLLHRGQPVQARHQRVLERGRNGERRQGPRQLVAVAEVPEEAGLEHELGELLGEERHPVGLGDDLIEHLLGQRLAPGHRGRDLVVWRRVKRLRVSVVRWALGPHGARNVGRAVITRSMGAVGI